MNPAKIDCTLREREDLGNQEDCVSHSLPRHRKVIQGGVTNTGFTSSPILVSFH